MTIGEKIFKMRKAIGLSQQELAERMGEKSAKVISNWENNLNMPSIDKLARLCSIFSCSPSWFIDAGKGLEITGDEMVLITKWRDLDALGKEAVNSTLDFFLSHCADTDLWRKS